MTNKITKIFSKQEQILRSWFICM